MKHALQKMKHATIILTEKFDLTEEEIRSQRDWRTPTEKLALVKELVKQGKIHKESDTKCQIDVNNITVEFELEVKMEQSKAWKSRGLDGRWDKPNHYKTKKAFPDFFKEFYLHFNVKGDYRNQRTQVLLKRYNWTKAEDGTYEKTVELVNKKVKLLGLKFGK